MRSLILFVSSLALFTPAFAQQVTIPCTEIDSIAADGTDTWNDNRLRAYRGNSGLDLQGYMRFDMSVVPNGAVINGLTLRTYHEEGFGNPFSDPQVRIYRADDDSWAWGVDDAYPGIDEILTPIISGSFPAGDAVPVDWVLDVNAADWSVDLADDELTLVMRNENLSYSYIYFYGHLGPDPVPELIVDYGDGGGNLLCDPANVHSGGTSVTLGNSSISGPGVLHLEATDGPPGEFGYFLVSLGVNEPGTAVSNGMLCLTPPTGRYAPASGGPLNSIGQFDAGGVMQNIAGTSTVGSGYDVLATLPTPPGGTITAGTSYYFQCWFRDGQRSNFSNVYKFQ